MIILPDKTYLVDLVKKAMEEQRDLLESKDAILNIHVQRLMKQDQEIKELTSRLTCEDCGNPLDGGPGPECASGHPAFNVAREKKVRQALEYLRSPTMGHDGNCSAEEFAEKHATDENVRLALVTCIRIAQQTTEELDNGD